MSAAFLLSLALAAQAAAAPPEPASLVLIVASNRGSQPGRTPLRYADDDAAKYFEVFSTIAGPGNAILLTQFDRDTAGLFPRLVGMARPPARAEVVRAGAVLAKKSAELARAGHAVRFYFVFAGHGDVDEGRGFLELSDGPFTADDLQALLRSVAASESHVILDSCNSFFVVNPRKPGGARFATPRDAAEVLSRRLPNVGVFLSTSAQAEAYEWSELQSGVFSHAVRSGLMGAADVNGDGAVSYAELAAFVDTAAADIKNPLFRPTVYARGPNGEDGRAILAFKGAPRLVLGVDDPRRVRLAARDADGLRWIDAYKEAGGTLELWLPPSLANRVEIDRLKTGPEERGRVESSFALTASTGSPARLGALAPAPSVVAMRGPGEIFQALFARPFGPAAFAAYLERQLSGDAAGVPDAALADSPSPGRGALAARDEGERPRFGFDALVRGGGTVPVGSWDGSSSVSVGIAAGLMLNSAVALEIEGAYFASGLETYFNYPSVGYPTNPVGGTDVQLQVVPLSLDARILIPTSPRPYVIVGAGVAAVHLTIDPPDFNATLRRTDAVPFFHAGFGLQFAVVDRYFAGVEARYFLMHDYRPFDTIRIALSGVTASMFVGGRL